MCYRFAFARVAHLLSLILLIAGCTSSDGVKFQQLDPEKSGISFTNTIFESDSINIFDFANIYNGGGVGVGDFNGDSLPDLYFTGNMVSNKLYLNQGHLKFEDVTDKTKTTGNGVWSRGVAVIDINNDKRLDLYVCATAKHDPKDRINLLYINEGNDKDGVPVFREMAKEYGLADSSQSTMAYFFDYDNDGDLDLFIAVNHILPDEYANKFRPRSLHGEHPSTSRLYRNDWDNKLNHPVFTNVSAQAGILIEGYSHAANIMDANNDGWLDIFIANDYISSNVLYINNHNGTFTDSVMQYFRHGASNSMGSDAVDINNDGLDDVIEVDMAAHDNFRKKMFQPPNSYQTYVNTEQYGYQYQYIRNMIQVNQGQTVGQKDTIKHPIYADLGYLSGIAETDWSWTPLVTDLDNDGFRDILFTNGFPKDITDRDFMNYRNEAKQLTSEADMLAEIPSVRISNYVFKNDGNLKFSDVSSLWGFSNPSFSNGAVYADLDNDGDMDIIINNIGEPASIYINKMYDKAEAKPHYLNIRFNGPAKNITGIGAKAILNYQSKIQSYVNNPYRGYISSVQPGLHFGLADVAEIDSLTIRWPDGKMQLLRKVKSDQNLTVNYSEASESYNLQMPLLASNTFISNITDSLTPAIVHVEDDFIDFNVQKLLPHKLSDLGPGLAVGDINGDGLDDMIMAASIGYSTKILTQQKNGKFNIRDLQPSPNRTTKASHDMGMLLFDADGDKDQDLFIAAGGNSWEAKLPSYSDHFYKNDGKGNFIIDTMALPGNNTSKAAVRAADFDHDGDLDLFIAGRCMPWQYPKPVSSFIYRNDSKDGKVVFTDVTAEVAKELLDIGLTCDGLFSDFDNDGWVDLVIAGEFMPVQFFKNNNGTFKRISTSIDAQKGWFNSLIAGDFDNDGDIDYVAGNNGTNTFFKASETYPVRVYGKDFDNNGAFDAIPSLYLVTSQTDTTLREYPANMRDDLIKQMIEMRARFRTYKDLAVSDFSKVLTPEQRNGATIATATNLSSLYIRNDGNGKFTMSPLPLAAQISSVFGMLAEDVNADGNLDLILVGNDYGTDVYVGRYDAFSGLVMLGDGNGNFAPQSILQSGFYLPGNAKAIVKLANSYKQVVLVATQNRGAMNSYLLKNARAERALSNEINCTIQLQNGKKRKEELYNGSGYLSNSGKFVIIGGSVKSLEFSDQKGAKRIVSF